MDEPVTTGAVTAAILSRRSFRGAFAPRPIARETLEQVVQCGLSAPSSKNARPWRFHVVVDPAMLADLAAFVVAAEGTETFVPADPLTGAPRPDWESTVIESAEALRQAPCGVFIENRAPFSRGRSTLAGAHATLMPDLLVGYTLEVLGIGAAVQSMWIAANSLGLQCTFIGDILIAEARIQDRLQMSGDLVGVLTMGYASSAPIAAQRGEPTDQVIWHPGAIE